jgi:hypothetical protein
MAKVIFHYRDSVAGTKNGWIPVILSSLKRINNLFDDIIRFYRFA